MKDIQDHPNPGAYIFVVRIDVPCIQCAGRQSAGDMEAKGLPGREVLDYLLEQKQIIIRQH